MRQSCVLSASRGEKAGKSETFKEDVELERVKGIEPSSQAWEARILPLNHTRFSDQAHL